MAETTVVCDQTPPLPVPQTTPLALTSTLQRRIAVPYPAQAFSASIRPSDGATDRGISRRLKTPAMGPPTEVLQARLEFVIPLRLRQVTSTAPLQAYSHATRPPHTTSPSCGCSKLRQNVQRSEVKAAMTHLQGMGASTVSWVPRPFHGCLHRFMGASNVSWVRAMTAWLQCAQRPGRRGLAEASNRRWCSVM